MRWNGGDLHIHKFWLEYASTEASTYLVSKHWSDIPDDTQGARVIKMRIQNKRDSDT